MTDTTRFLTILMLAIAVFTTGCLQEQTMEHLKPGSGEAGSVINLSGDWTFRQSGTTDRIPATVPGCNYLDLMDAGRIEDPLFGMNELDSLWVGDVDWEYERTFQVTPGILNRKCHWLVCEGLDTIASIEINGELIGRTDNMFRQYRFIVGPYLRWGNNTIRIRFESPVKYGRNYRIQQPYELPGSEYDWGTGRKKKVYRPYVRKAQYQFGWDWGPSLISAGIWRDIRIVASDVPQILNVTTRQIHTDDRVRVTVDTNMLAPESTSGRLVIQIGDQHTYHNTRLAAGESTLKGLIDIENPKIWWPRGHGDQPLYPMTIRWEDRENGQTTTYEDHIGLRKVELVRQPDGKGETFLLRVNDRDIFCRGANWIPPDPFPSRVTPEIYEYLIRSAADANMNTIRVWGGGIYEEKIFYDLCDEYGMMVWQDLMFACAAYPSDDAFLANVDDEIRQQVKRLGNHPSIVLWCGNNENEGAILHWYGQEMKEKLWPGYLKLTNDVCGVAVREEAPDTPWWPSSPSSGEGYDPNELNRGDQHFWEVWHMGKPFERYLEIVPRFCSEFGFQSFPHLQTLQGAIGSEQTDITSPMMRQHQRHGRGNSIIADTLSRYFWQPENLDDLCYLSQISHGMALKWAVEHWRRNKPECMGALYWQLHDCWVAASWASIDYELRYKAAHYMAKRFFNPLLGTLVCKDHSLQVWATSDIPKQLEGTWTLQGWTMEGKMANAVSGSFDLQPQQSLKLASIPVSELFDESIPLNQRIVRLVLSTEDREHQNIFTFVPFKDLEIRKPELSVTFSQEDVSVSSDVVAMFVEVFPGNGEYDDNYFHIFPGETRTLHWTANGFIPGRPRIQVLPSEEMQIRSLFDTLKRK